jgi:sodium transport system permease protein
VNWRDVWIVFRREMRTALRERTVVVNGLLMPVFLYPLLLWAMFTTLVFVQGLTEGFTSRVVLLNVPEAHRALVDTLRAHEDVELGEASTADAFRMLGAGELDAVVEVLPAEGGAAALEDNFRVRVRYDRLEERSVQARTRVRAIIDDYQDGWVKREAEAMGIPEEDLERFRVIPRNMSTSREMGSIVLGQMIPLFLVVMVAVGCFIPAIDTTAGERERSTWETTMTVAASRLSIVTAKYLHVAALGIIAGVLNVVAVFVSIGAVLRPILGGSDGGVTFSIPWLAVPVMSAGAACLALFFAAAMMILAAFAKTFKEGQAMVTPVYALVLLPLLLGTQTDRTLSPILAAIPVANVAMMIRDALTGVFHWALIVETLAVTLALVVGCVVLARAILRFEEFVLGSHDGSIWRFMTRRFGWGGSDTRPVQTGVEALGD